MAKDAIVSQELADKFKTEKDSPYLRFVRGEGLDIISAQYVPNLRTAELKPWARKSGKGVFINHEASRTSNDCYVCEIAPGRKLEPQHHLFEEMILVLSGRGSTTVWNNAGARVTFEWKAGAIFAIPLNCWYQHFNGSGQEPVRYVAVTNAPSVINLYDDIDFVFNHRHDFVNRFSGEADYYSAKGEQIGFLLQTNFVSDAVNLPLIAAKERGAGGGHIRFNMARGSIASHISQFPVGTYKKAHAHGPGAHVIVLSGEGYSLMWPEGEEPRRYDWQVGTLIVPPNAWFHQHFNSGPTPARYLAFKHWSPRNAQGVPISWISRRLGGTQVDYADEHPLVRRMFAEALARHGPGARAWTRSTPPNSPICRPRRRKHGPAKQTTGAPPALHPAAMHARPRLLTLDRHRHRRDPGAVAVRVANLDPHRPGLGCRGGPLSPAHLCPDGALDHRSTFATTPRRTTRDASPFWFSRCLPRSPVWRPSLPNSASARAASAPERSSRWRRSPSFCPGPSSTPSSRSTMPTTITASTAPSAAGSNSPTTPIPTTGTSSISPSSSA